MDVRFSHHATPSKYKRKENKAFSGREHSNQVSLFPWANCALYRSGNAFWGRGVCHRCQGYGDWEANTAVRTVHRLWSARCVRACGTQTCIHTHTHSHLHTEAGRKFSCHGSCTLVTVFHAWHSDWKHVHLVWKAVSSPWENLRTKSKFVQNFCWHLLIWLLYDLTTMERRE